MTEGYLSIEDLREVRQELQDVREKWYDLGIELGLFVPILRNIRVENPGSNLACLTEMLTEWLKKANPEPSWQVLVESLSQPTVFEEALAHKIARRHGVPIEVGAASTPVGSITPDPNDTPTSSSSPSPVTIPVIDDGRPTLSELMKFPSKRGTVNIIQRIGVHYSTFGVFLLADDMGSRVPAIAHKCMNNPEQINIKIFQEWLAGSGVHPISWETLVQVLDTIELRTLARDIAEVKLQG